MCASAIACARRMNVGLQDLVMLLVSALLLAYLAYALLRPEKF